jgi:hypothetical protein
VAALLRDDDDVIGVAFVTVVVVIAADVVPDSETIFNRAKIKVYEQARLVTLNDNKSYEEVLNK